MTRKSAAVFDMLTLNGVLLRYKLPFVMVLLALIAAAGVGFSGYSAVTGYLSKSVAERLFTTNGSDASAVSRRWGQLEAEIHVQASSAFAALAVEEMSKWMEISEGDRKQIIAHYQGDGKRSLDERVAETGRSHRHGYSWRHGPIHDTYASVMSKFGYADIFLISKTGRVVYSTTKGPEFAELLDGDLLKGSGIKAAFEAASKSELGQLNIVDFSVHARTGGENRAFLAQPIYEPEEFANKNAVRRMVGVLVVAVTPGIIDDVLSQTKANGAKARSFIIGQDGTMHSSHASAEPEFIPDSTKALPGHSASGNTLALASRTGVEMIGAAQSLPIIKSAPWTVVTVEHRQTALGLVQQVRNAMVLASVMVILPVMIAAIWIGWSVAKPVSSLAQALQSIAAGRTENSIPARERRDEIGAIADAVHLIRENIATSNLKREREQEGHALQAASQRKEILSELARDLDKSVGDIASAVSAAAEELNATARELDKGANETRFSADAMSAATSRVVHNMQGIDSSAVALCRAVDEIDNEVRQADGVAESASQKARNTQEIVLRLDEGARRVSDVVGLISSIAEQTNLLALNATIEAARAGEAGRGFAVVAAEVKQLASQTAKATDEIARQISLMNDATRSSVDAIGDIQDAIAELSAVTRRTALSVSEQKLASRAIVDDVNTVSHEIADISAGTSQVGAASGQTFQSAQAVLSAASELTQQASELQMRVEGFIAKVRTA